MRKKNLMDKTTGAISGAAKTVADGLKSAGQAVAEAITPKPIRAGNKLIIPSADASMPPVIVPVRKRARRATSRKPAAKGRTTARKTKSAAPRKSAKRPARKATGRPTTKTARR
jgi:hypothetical protein